MEMFCGSYHKRHGMGRGNNHGFDVKIGSLHFLQKTTKEIKMMLWKADDYFWISRFQDSDLCYNQDNITQHRIRGNSYVWILQKTETA